ncbi:MAG TPA: hypothetical protein VFX98_15480 [Longimicrobiaceae bacterium]|nr:hypothetical protein [Longimicrobiaceae bacterium]
MKKLRLRLEALTVESFPTAPATEPLGTVHAAEGTLRTRCEYTCVEPTCQGNTCVTSCGGGGDPACTCPIW